MSPLEQFHGPNAGYVIDLYDRYLANPESVDPETRATFEKWRPDGDVAVASAHVPCGLDISTVVHAARVARLVRELGHLTAHIDPLGTAPPGDPDLDLSAHHL